MFRLSEQIAKLEDRWGRKLGRFRERHGKKCKRWFPLALTGWYFYGMLINSIRLGTESTFNATGEPIDSIWVADPTRNFLAVFSPTGLAVTAVGALLVCLITKKGYLWFSGYKYIHDKRGFDILPDGTHGTSGFMGRKEQEKVLRTGSIQDLDRTLLGKQKDHPEDSDKYAEYVTLKPGSGLTEHTMIYGATGSGKTRGFVKPFILQTARRKESMVLVDPKGEIYESMSAFLQEEGYEVRMFNLLDMENSDAWNCLSEIEHDKDLVQSIAEVIIKNTSNANERQDFWEKAELNLLMALMHYVASQTVPGTNELLPIQQRSLGAIYRMLSNESFADLERRFDELPKGHPALPPYGIFKLANRQIWGNIAIGLGNRLSVFQNPLVDKITSYNEIDLTLPGRKPCAYFCCISAQDSSLEFLSSLFFSQLFTSLMDYGRREGDHGRLPVTVNVCLEEFCNIGKLMDFKRVLNVCRGSAIFCQIIVQSIPQLQDRYPNTEWEELIGCTDIQICLGCNDVDTATYISKKCGMVTIKVENNQMPLMPLFSPVYTSTRPYSQTKSNTQRPLMFPDEVLRMDNKECLVLLRGEKPLHLYKIIPDEHPSFQRLRDVRVADHVPLWRQEMPKTRKPSFPLMKQGDIQTIYHLQMPRWLFTDPHYTGLTLEAKVAYTFLLNRFQLSRLNGWVNEDGAVFIIFTRRSLAEEMQVSYRKVIEAMKQLSAAGLIWEKRCGRGDANQIYLALVDHSDHCTNSAAPFVDPGHEAAGGEPVPEPPEQEAASRSAGSAPLGPEPQQAEPFAPISEMPDQHLQKSQNGTSGSTETAFLEVPELHPNYKEIRKKDLSHIEYSPSVSGGERTGQTDAEPLKGGDGYVRMSEAEQLARILDNCELWAFGPETAKVFANAIERLFYSDQLRIGKAVLPQANVRSRLWDLDATVLQAVQAKLQRNQRDIKNSTAYVMAVIFNTICEAQSDLLVDPYLNGLNGPDG